MKKNFLFGMFAMAAFTMVGCSQDEAVVDHSPENAIQFGTYLGRDAEGRAHAITDTELAKEGFGVLAYYTNGGGFSSSATPNFMWNQFVQGKKSGEAPNETYSTTDWVYSPLKYWPNEASDKLSFFAYAPYQDQTASQKNITLSGNTITGTPVVTFNVPTTVTEHQDLLWATPVIDVVKNTTNGIDIEDKIKFNFHHALARIGFKVQAMVDKVNPDTDGKNDNDTTNGELDNNTTILIQSVTLKGNFYSTGSLTFGTDYSATMNGSGTSNTITYELGNSNFISTETVNDQTGQKVTTVKSTLNNNESYIMIIPRNADSNSNLEIYVKYQVITKDNNLDGGYSTVQNEITTSFSDVDFKQGNAYIFSLHLGMTSVKLEANVADSWNDTDISVNLPINTTGTTNNNTGVNN